MLIRDEVEEFLLHTEVHLSLALAYIQHLLRRG